MYEDVDSIPKYINVIKDARKRLSRAAMTITDEQVMAISSHAVLASGNYDTECREWNKLLTDQRMWFVWKTTFCNANSARIQAGGVCVKSGQPFGEFAKAAAQQQTQQQTPADTTPPCDAQMANTNAGYMDNLANTVSVDSGKFAAVNKRLAEITATLKSLAESNALFAANVSE